MDDFEAELNRFLSTGTVSGSSAPEAKVDQKPAAGPDFNLDAETFLKGGQQTPIAPTSPAPPLDFEEGARKFLGTPSVDQQLPSGGAFNVPPQLEAPVPAEPVADEGPGFLDKFGNALTGGLKRGAAQVTATPYDLAGIASEVAGDEEAAQQAYESARRIESFAGPSEYTWDDVNDAEGFAVWLAEKFGEQAPVFATLFTGAGAGGLAARLAGKGLLRSAAARAAASRAGMAVGGAGAGIGLETAGTGSELKQATGSYQPDTAVAAGAVKGILEWYGPAKLLKGISNPASTILGEAGKSFVREGLTEGAQEIVDATARAFEDEKYSFWSRDTYVRVRESALAGAFVGGGVGAGGKAIGKALGVGEGQKPGEVRDYVPDPNAPANPGSQPSTDLNEQPPEAEFDKEETWLNPLTWLRRKLGKQSKIGPDAALEPTDDPLTDYSEAGKIFSNVRRSWELAGIGQEQIDNILDFEDANTPRYFLYDRATGKALTDRALTNTEAELELSLLPQDARPAIIEADLRNMNAASLTAEEMDLPISGSDPRIFFTPKVPKAQQAALRKQYQDMIGSMAASAKDTSMMTAEYRATVRKRIQQYYVPLVEAGLRVVPSRGNGFIYKGEVKGKEVYDLTSSGRMTVLLPESRSARKGTKLLRPKSDVSMLFGTNATEDPYTYPVTLDFNKLKWEDGYSVMKPPGVTKRENHRLPTGSWQDFMVFRDKNLSQAEKDKLTTKLLDAWEDSDIQKAWEAGVMFDPTKADIDAFVMMRDVDLFKQTVGTARPGQDAVDLKFQNTQFDSAGATVVARGLDQQIANTRTVNPELARIMQELLDGLKEISPMIHELGKRMGMRPFDIKIETSVQGTAAWDGNKREITFGVFSLASAFRQGIWSTNDLKLAAWRIMLHEFGHGLTFEHYINLPAEWRLSLRTAYERARLYARMTENPAKTSPHLPGTDVQLSPISYYLKYTEWLTEQFTRWAISSAIPRSNDELALQRISKAFEKYGKEFVDLVGEENARNITQPSWQFAKVMEYLKGINFQLIKPMVAQIDQSRALYEIPAFDEVTKLVEQFRQLIPAGTQVVVAEGGGDQAAQYLPDSNIIRLFAGVLTKQGLDPVRAIAHEAGHACWGLFTEAERSLLVQAAREANLIPRDQLTWYTNHYRKQGVDGEQLTALLDEERVMFMLDARAAGRVFAPQVNGLLDALLEFFKRVRNMLNGLGFQSVDDVVRAFYSGEVAARERRVALQAGARRARATDGREKAIDPQKVVQVEPNLFMAVEMYPEGAMYRYYLGPAADTQLTGDPKADLMLLGEEVGYASLTYYGEAKGYDVDMVQVNDKFNVRSAAKLREMGGETYVQKFMRSAEADLGRPFKASGIMTQAGYRSRKRHAPLELRWHVFDEVSKMWYSPNYINDQINEWSYELDRVKLGEESRYSRADATGMLNKWKRLKAKVDPNAWNDPTLPDQFMTDKATAARITQAEAELGLNKIEGEIEENKYVKSLSGEELGPTVSKFDQVDAADQRTFQAKNMRDLKLDDPQLAAPMQDDTQIVAAIFRKGEDSRTIDPLLSGRRTNIPGEADRISRFSKLLMGIQQIAWRNQHLRPMQIFVSLINQMQALRMKWVARADETARAWDRDLNERDRTGLTDLLFWATEMEYRTPQEVANNVVRQPTAAEIAAFITRNQLGPEVFQMYNRVQGDFDAFLTEVERVSVKNLQRQFLTGPNPNQAAYQAAIAELQRDMKAMRARPYFPMVRFGQWTITIRDPGQNDQVVFFSAYASERERDSAVRQMADDWAGHRIQIGRVTEDLHEFMGLPAPLLRAIKGMPGLSQTQQDWIDQFMHQSSPERSFRKRWLQRKGTPGYSRDGIRAYSHYFLSGANYLAKLDFKEEMTDQIQMLRQTLPGLADTKKRSLIIEAMQAAHKYIMEPGRDWAKFKSFVSLWQLGFSPAAAAMNLLQSPTVTLPYFSGIYGGGANVLMIQCINGLKRAGLSYRPAAGNAQQFDAARVVLQQMGKIDVGQAPELGSYAEGYNLLNLSAGTRAQRFWRQLSHLGMAMFAVAERINREVAFGMSWHYSTKEPNHAHLTQIEQTYFTEINQLQGQTILVEGQPVVLSRDTAIAVIAAREAIDRTQFVYAPWARPGFLRNPLASSFLVFFQYTQAMIYAFGNNPGRVKMFLVYASLFGLLGLPGADDLDEVLNAIAKRIFGKEFSLEDEARKFVRELTRGTIFDEVGPDLLIHGLSRYSFGPGLLQEGYGIPQFDASANGSLGQVVPGLAQAASAFGNRRDWKELTAEVARDTAGAGFGQMFSLLQFLSSDPFTMDQKKWEAIMPRSVRAMSKASRYYLEERERTKQGGTLVEFDPKDPDDLATIAMQAFGFSPTKINQKWDAIGKVNDTYQYFQGRKMSIMSQYNEAFMWKDKETIASIRGRILEFNREVRERGLTGMSITSEGLKQSLTGRTRARVMQDQGMPAQKNQIQIQRKTGDEMYPGVFEKKVK